MLNFKSFFGGSFDYFDYRNDFRVYDFFPIVVALVFLKILMKNNLVFFKVFFPKYYLFGIIITLIGIFVSAFEKDFIIVFSFSLIFLGFVFSRQYLTPLINKAKDEITKSDDLSKVKFERLHRFSVIINILQIFVCIIILFYKIIN